MRSELAAELKIFSQSVIRFIENEIAPYYHRWEENKCVPKSVWLKMGQ